MKISKTILAIILVVSIMLTSGILFFIVNNRNDGRTDKNTWLLMRRRNFTKNLEEELVKRRQYLEELEKIILKNKLD